jgi:hypothetical protein
MLVHNLQVAEIVVDLYLGKKTNLKLLDIKNTKLFIR